MNDLSTLPKSHSRTIGAFTNDLLHKTTYIPIKLALFWVMLGSWPFESKQILTWPFQRGIIQLCRSKGCQMTSPQSPAIKCCLAGLALAQLERPAAASAGATPNLSLDLSSRLRLWGLVIWQPFDLQSCMMPLWNSQISICLDSKAQEPSMAQNEASFMGI